jgi:hypothetical protein
MTDQVLSVGELAINIATLGSSAAATTQFQQLRTTVKTAMKNYDYFFDAVETAEEIYSVSGDALSLYEIFTNDQELTEPADIVNVAASVASLFDPTGISGVIAAYSYPLCSDVFAPTSAPTEAPGLFEGGVLNRVRGDECGLFGRGIFCPSTRCGVFGRLFGRCEE